MKFISAILITALLSLVTCLFLPWWYIAPVSFLVAALIKQSPGRSFLTGFLALFFLWTTLSWYISFKNENILAHKISLVVLKIDSPILLIFVTGFVGAIVAAFAATAGSYLRTR